MLRPELKPHGMGYVATFSDTSGDEVVAFDIERIDLSPSGPVGTVTVRSHVVGSRRVPGTDVLFTDRLYLYGSRAKADFVKQLGEAMPHPAGGASIDWLLVMNSLVNMLMTEQRKPSRLVDLSTMPRMAEPHYIVPGFLPDGKATILYGAGGTGKSMFAAGIAAAVQTGCSFAGFGHIEQGNVLYLDWETDEHDLGDRVYKASRGLGLTSPAPVTYLACTKPMEQMHTEVARIVKERAISLVIVDSVGMATAGSASGDMADGAIRFFLGLRALGCSVLAIDHIASEDLKGKGGSKKPFGSVFKVNAARNTFELELMDGAPTGEHWVIMRHRKTNMSARLEDRTYRVDWTPDDVRFVQTSFVPVAVTPLTVRIERLLEVGPLSVDDLVESLNTDGGPTVSDGEVRLTVRSMLYEREVAIEEQKVVLTKE